MTDRRHPLLPLLLGAALAMLVPLCARAQSTISVLPSARVEPGRPVLLSQVATLAGPEAEALASTIIVPILRGSADATVSLDQLRAALDGAPGINWGRLALRGSSCRIITAPAPASPAPPPGRPTSTEKPAHDAATIRAAVAHRIAQVARAAPADLRLAYAPEDHPFLDQAVGGRALEIRLTAHADRLPLAITLYDGDRIAASRTIRVGVEVRRTVAVAGVAKRRADLLAPEDLTTEQRWLPLTAAPAAAEQAVGASVATRLVPGQMITAADVTPPFVVAKGDHVTVHCVSGGVVLTTRARATGPARDGELVELQSLDAKRRFQARMNGRGRAVIAAEPAPEFTR
ncbi:MAG: flagellar basal body P-ring formation chaperone FlgA [Phycisphaerales bacterium]